MVLCDSQGTYLTHEGEMQPEVVAAKEHLLSGARALTQPQARQYINSQLGAVQQLFQQVERQSGIKTNAKKTATAHKLSPVREPTHCYLGLG